MNFYGFDKTLLVYGWYFTFGDVTVVLFNSDVKYGSIKLEFS